ncbi:MAG: DUF3095 domain-containing protein [Deltaproteobacteria bacterium]|jgi:hypothetical protein|nr:DUF3095 domain-containing protein [Deltaproteobacteria bacterium]
MNVSSESFYSDLMPFTKFSDLTNATHYRAVPEDWWIIVTDIVGSTKAIEQNRYKDVNLLGASSIVAILNKLKGKQIPFVFGGDGATILIHNSDLKVVRPALIGAQRLARDVFSMELRAGLVPVIELLNRGATIEVAKFAISEKSQIATIRGGGLQLAEKLIKNPLPEFDKYRVIQLKNESANSANFEGLSCRWNPIKARKGEIMSLLVMATVKEEASSVKTYKDVIVLLESILDESDSRPVTPEKIDRGLALSSLIKEMKIQAMGKSFFGHFKHLLAIFFEVAVMRILMLTGAKVKGWFTAEGYIRDLSANTDFQKFDDMIRMVRDCTKDQREKILAGLEKMKLERKIVYGAHFSNEALMTCLVFQLDNHIHFVDGGGGGYALAAKQLKAQLNQLS